MARPHWLSPQAVLQALSWSSCGLALAKDSSATLMLDGSLRLATVAPQRRCLPLLRSTIVGPRTATGCWLVAGLSRFHRHSESVGVERGGVACFQCLIRGVPEPSISWEHNVTTLSTADRWVTLLPSGILLITSVSQADVGTYRCMARNVANTRHSQDAWLTLSGGSPRLLQEPESLLGPQNLTLTVQQRAVLECIVSWSRLDGRSIGVEGIQVLGTGNLIISNVSVQHLGIYICAANRPGIRVRHTAQGVLLVQAPPEFVQWPQPLSKPPGSSAVFTCVAQGVPEPRLVWLKNGKVLSPGDNIQLTHNNSTLMLVRVSAEDEAIYQCVAENSMGSNQASACLAVTGDPEPPPAPRGLQAMALSSSAIRVSWEAPPSDRAVIGYALPLRPVGERASPGLQEAVGRGTFEHVFSNLELATASSTQLRAYSAEGVSIHTSTTGSTPAALGFSTTVLNATSVQASWQLPPQPGPIQGFKFFYHKLPAAHFEGPLLLASNGSSFLYTHLEPAALYEIKLQAFNGNGDGDSSAGFVSLHGVPLATAESQAECSCSRDESSPLPGVVVGVHVGLAAIIVCLFCLLLGWRHSVLCRQGSRQCLRLPRTELRAVEARL